nr:PREDICTED: transmembrane protein FLJ37396 [Struthio camelus australis]
MELFFLVVQKFRSIFCKQQTMRTFPVYDAEVSRSENWGMLDPTRALKKRANWIPFLRIKPKVDPWQQKLLIKLKQWKKVDKLMDLHSKFVEELNTEDDDNAAVAHSGEDVENTSPSKPPESSGKNKRGYSYTTTFQLLGLEEGTEVVNKEHVLKKGAYLSVLYLRHLRIRELQRVCLGFLNYFRSVERTLTISTAGLSFKAGNLIPSAEDTCWVSAAKGGIGVSGGLSSQPYIHYTPADYKVHSAQFMEFAEVENHDDFYTSEGGYIHTQDPRGLYIIYDVALKDLKELEHQLLLVTSQYIEKDKSHVTCGQFRGSNLLGWAHASVDRFAVLLDLWTCETALLEKKCQLLDVYFEAYQHAIDPEERFALAQTIVDVMHKRPRFDLKLGYFVDTYRDECICLQLHLQLLRGIVNQQIDVQREYVHKVWQEGQKGGVSEFGLPYNVITKQLISLNNSCPTSKNIYLLEFHPSLGLVCLIPKAVEHIYQEFCNILRPKTASEASNLEKQVLQLAVDEWLTMEKAESFYSSQIQKDLFAEVLIEDPVLVQEIALSLLELRADEEKKESREKQFFLLDSFSMILELVTLRHRLIEVATESAQLARLYKAFAREMGFGEFHLYLRPVHFEFASYKEKADHIPPIFITSLLEDDSCVDRYIPSNLQLGIQEIDSHIGKFSFRTRDGVMQLLSPSGIKNMQLILACQVIQKNALLVAVQQASFCYLVQPTHARDTKEGNIRLTSWSSSASGRNSVSGNEIENRLLQATTAATSCSPGRSSDLHCTINRPAEAFVSIQLEKLGPRDMMLNAFIQKKETMGSRMQNPDELLKFKRDVIVEYCYKLNQRVSQHALRGQLIAYYNSLRSLLDDFPVIRDKYFIIGLSQGKKEEQNLKKYLAADPRSFHPRPRCLLSPDGRTFLNLWFIPHPSEVLIMFKMLPEKAALRALHLSLEIVGALHDMVSYLLGFAQLGNSSNCFYALNPEPLTPDWGGTERIGTELQEIQKMIDSLQNPLDPSKVAQLLAIHREVMFLQFDAAIRHRLRETFLSSGNVSAYQSVTDRICHALPPLSNSVIQSAFASQLRLPQLLDPQSCRTLMHFPWRTFLMDGGLFPVTVNNTINISYNMQLCLCDLSDADRRVAHGELAAMQLLMEDVLQNSCGCAVEDHADYRASLAKSKQENLAEIMDSSANWLQSRKKTCRVLLRHHDPVTSCNLLRSFLILWKQLEILKAEWGRLKLRTEDINTVPLYKEFCEQYGTDVLHPAMKALARQMGAEEELGEPVTSIQHIRFPQGASEIEMKVYQLRKLLENLEIHMIRDVQKKINQQMTLVTSERARQGSSLPTELWKHGVIQENFSAVRPQIVETFVQKLMQNYQESDAEVTFKKSHLQQCLTVLGCDIMARERSNFETYSMFYENILQQQHRLLYQKEQELHAAQEGGNLCDTALTQIAGLSHGMIMEITALRAQLADSEEENLGLKEKIRKEVRDEYESLVRSLFVTCIHLKGRLDDYRLSIDQRVFEIISEVRREGVDNMIDLKKKFGSAKNNDDLKEHLSKEQLQFLRDENIRLGKLVCKLKALNCWKQTTQKAQLSAKLRDAEKEAVQNKKEWLNTKMMAEQEVTLFQGQLAAVRKALAKSQADNGKLKKQLEKQKQMLLEVEHRKTQEARSRQILSAMKAEHMKKTLEEMEEKEQRLKYLIKEAEKSSKMGQLQQKRVKKEMQQIRSQLTQECSLKLEAFQRVDELQQQVYALEAAVSQRNASAGSVAWVQSSRHSAAAQLRNYQQHPLKPHARSRTLTGGTPQRAKTVPSRWRERMAAMLLPHLNEQSLPAIFMQLQEQGLVQKQT